MAIEFYGENETISANDMDDLDIDVRLDARDAEPTVSESSGPCTTGTNLHLCC